MKMTKEEQNFLIEKYRHEGLKGRAITQRLKKVEEELYFTDRLKQLEVKLAKVPYPSFKEKFEKLWS